MTPPEVRVIGITAMPEVRTGDDLAGMIVDAVEAQGTGFLDGDILVVTQKVVSKAEGRLVALSDVEPSSFAQTIADRYDKDARHVEVVLRESRRIVRMDHGVIITENRLGHICANSGVDASNLETQGLLALLPEDPDRSCQELRSEVRRRTNVEVAVIMSDTFGRPWREGCTNVAIGVSGIDPLIDYSGQEDPSGFVLRVSVLAIADELAAAAELVMGKMDRVPAAIARGYPYPRAQGSSSSLIRSPDKDLFR